MFCEVVCVTARLGEIINKRYRYLELDRIVPDLNKDRIDKIPIRHWASKGPKCTFMTLRTGSLISLKGRLEVDDEVGVAIVMEDWYVISREPSTKMANSEELKGE